MIKNNRETGSIYEEKAVRYLEEQGLRVLEQNYRCRIGEIDIIAEDGAELVFCEVKYRTSERKGHPLEAVDARKQSVISKTAAYYLTCSRRQNCACRFDVVGFLKEEIIHIKNAFEYRGGYM